MELKTIIPVVILSIFGIFAGDSNADVVSYGDFAGATVDFIDVIETSESIGTDPGDVPELYGAPTVSGDSLVFDPAFFQSLQEGSGTSLVDGELSFVVEAQDGFEITNVTYSEFGDYRLSTPFATSGGEAEVSVTATGFATADGVTLNDSFSQVQTGSAAAGSLVAGVFVDGFSINVAPTGVVSVTLNNTLIASALTSTDGSIIDKQGVTISIDTQAVTTTTVPVPEPSSLGIIVLAAAGLVVRRKRSV